MALRILLRGLGYGALGLGLGIVAAIAAPLVAGQRPYTVLSGSMEPATGRVTSWSSSESLHPTGAWGAS